MSTKHLAHFPRSNVADALPQPAFRRMASVSGSEPGATIVQDFELLAAQFLRAIHLLLRSVRLYHQHHPRLIETLKSAGRALDDALNGAAILAFTVDRDGLAVLAHPTGSTRLIADPRAELKALAEVFGRAHIRTLSFVPRTRLDELLRFARAVDEAHHTQKQSEVDWPSRLREYRVTGIRINDAPARPGDPIQFAGLLEALLGAGLEPGVSAGLAANATPDEFRTALRSLWASSMRLENVRPDAPQEVARTIRSEFGAADELVRALVIRGTALESQGLNETLGGYLSRVAEALSIDRVRAEFLAKRLPPTEIRLALAQFHSERADRVDNSEQIDAALDAMVERFWRSIPARERTRLLASPDAWCLPASVLREYLEGLIAAAVKRRAEASRREARRALAGYVRCLSSEEEKARRSVASSLLEMKDVLEHLWPSPQLAGLGKQVIAALRREQSPGIANLLEEIAEKLSKLALARGECAEIEAILNAIDQPPVEAYDARLGVLARRIVGSEEWLLLVDLALANRPLDPALPRLLRRDPDRLLDRLRLLLTSTAGLSSLPAMARIVRAAGEPVLGALETHLLEPRRQRVATSIKLLSAAAPERLISALPKAFSSWDWSLQDLAVTELARQAVPALRPRVAQTFLLILPEAHLLVMPGIIDQIGLYSDADALPKLIEIATGEAERLNDVFIRIKAIEALGRMKAAAAAPLLRNLVRNRSGLTYAEPAGLRSAAEEALAIIEDRAGSLSLRTGPKPARTSSGLFAQPRRYLRIGLADPLDAKLEGPRTQTARVRSIALGGALLETSARFDLGESVRIEIHAGFDKIRATAVVRSISSKGCGVEFVHMSQQDREKLRRRINKLLD